MTTTEGTDSTESAQEPLETAQQHEGGTEETPPEGTPEPPTAPEETEENAGNREAARYRRRLRETEAERDGLAERLTTYQRREAEQIAAEHLSRPSDLWLDGAEVSTLLTEDGAIDPLQVKSTVEGVLDGRAQLAKDYGKTVDFGAGKREPAAHAGAWKDVLNNRR